MEPEQIVEKEPFEFRLKRYYYAVDVVGIFLPLAVGGFMYAFPSLFPWIIHPIINAWAFAILVVVQGIDFLLFQKFRKKFIFDLSRYIYVVFFALYLFDTGGIQSTYLIIMMFPLVVSGVDLDPTMTRNIGIAVCTSLVVLFFTNPANIHSSVAIADYSIRLVLFIFLSYFMFKLVRETLLQKYQKEEASRKFTKLVQVDQLKNDFLSVAQHQLRTPLSGIKWALESVADDHGLSDQSKGLVKSGIVRTQDAISIVNEMLKTVEEGKGSLVLSAQPVDIVSMIKKILEELNYVVIHKGVSVRFVSPPILVAKVDISKLKPSFTNIIDNALKYSPKGHITLTLSDADPNFMFKVSDDGIGISEGDLAYVFNRLFRGKNALLLEPDESGVGLYTAKRMIELHNGTIALDSKLGKGTTVMVTLPK